MTRALAFLAALAFAAPAPARELPRVPGLTAERLDAEYWIARLPAPDARLLDAKAIAAHDARLAATEPTYHDLAQLPAALAHDDVRGRIEKLSRLPNPPLLDAGGEPFDARRRRTLVRSLALERIAQHPDVRWGLVVRRAPMRTFPTMLRAFRAPPDPDIDRFQETALFPGTPVALLHESRDREWWFARSALYEAWIRKAHVATGTKEQVLAYARREPRLVVTGATVRTAFTPQRPALSALQLDMGVSVPLLADWPLARPVNGQGALGSYVVELPLRASDGTLAFSPALVARTADLSPQPLPLTRANLLRQSFKFLGERYGWGHDYDARDCSGFVSEVYRSFGVVLPRNAGDQAASPALERIADGAESARAMLGALDVGDLVHVPGHVMMVIGHVDGAPWVIHDTAGVNVAGADGASERLVMNGVVVTPLVDLRADDGRALVERITVVQRVRRSRVP